MKNTNMVALNELLREYGTGFEHGSLFLDFDNVGTRVDLVVYDSSEMLETPENVESFRDIIKENALDKSKFEIDRVNFSEM